MPGTDADPELGLDRQLVRAALTTTTAGVAVAAALGGVTGGTSGALGAAWGVAVVGLTAAAAAQVSASGGKTSRGIDVPRVVAAVPARLVVIALALWLAVGTLGLPSRTVAAAVCLGEIAVLLRWSLLVLHGRTFVGPLTSKGDA